MKNHEKKIIEKFYSKEEMKKKLLEELSKTSSFKEVMEDFAKS